MGGDQHRAGAALLGALIEDLAPGPVGIDTPVFIYYIEEHPRFIPLLDPLFEAIDAGQMEGVTSGISLTETLVLSHRRSDLSLASRYETLLTRSRNLRFIDTTARF